MNLQRERRCHEADHRHDAKTRAHLVTVEEAEHLDMGARQTDLLFGLAQRGCDRRGIGRVDLAAGKRDLAGMRSHGLRPLDQDHGEFAARDDRYQHRRGPRGDVRCAPRRVHRVVAARRLETVVPHTR
jgi:hypothetical protein